MDNNWFLITPYCQGQSQIPYPVDANSTYINGTDGFQFKPNLIHNPELRVSSDKFKRNIPFKFNGSDGESYPGHSIDKYVVSENFTKSMRNYPVNEPYGVYYAGTSNQSYQGDNYFFTKGHYFELDPELQKFVPKIIDAEGKPMQPNKTIDDPYLKIHVKSGVTVEM